MGAGPQRSPGDNSTLQNTRSGYVDQLETLFVEGSAGDPAELDIPVDLSPVVESLTSPIRESVESALGWLSFLDRESVEALSPEVVIDVDTAADGETDPYTWAAAAAASRHWATFAGVAGVLTVLGLLLGHRRGRWAALSLGGLLAAGLGVWVALTAASPQIGQARIGEKEDLPATGTAVLDHVETEFAQWAQPAWWVFTGASGVVGLIGVSAAVAAAPAGGRAGHRLDTARDRPVDWPA